ncbi:hypothetical protein [Mycoplasmopsis gallinarum]|uniref:hypothetical protein n=1 Tax=Mycoplasmopsis gallinarum TaxID=29557 RepID=UPI000489C962|nr:hypothetical protein [Mycoplasmopsis gallinarum]
MKKKKKTDQDIVLNNQSAFKQINLIKSLIKKKSQLSNDLDFFMQLTNNKNLIYEFADELFDLNNYQFDNLKKIIETKKIMEIIQQIEQFENTANDYKIDIFKNLNFESGDLDYLLISENENVNDESKSLDLDIANKTSDFEHSQTIEIAIDKNFNF